MRAIDVPDVRRHFVREWGPKGFFTDGLIERIGSSGSFAASQGLDNARMMEASLRRAELFWVSPSFTPLLLRAADSLPREVRYSEIPPLPRDGLLVFQVSKGWTVVDDLADPDAVALTWGTTSMVLPESGKRVVGIAAEAYARYGSNRWINLRSCSWADDDPVGVKHSPHPDDGPDARARIERDRRIMAAFSYLLTQRLLTDVRREAMPRGVVRRCAREGLPSDVRVVRLRELVAEATGRSDHDGPGIEYSHRWIVSGHWRNQPSGPGRTQRHLTWVSPHVKGPADKPLIVKETVKALVR